MYATYQTSIRWTSVVIFAFAALSVAGCGPSYRQLRIEGQRAVVDGEWGAARHLFEQANAKKPGDPANLHDLGVCSTMLARHQFELENHAAGMREADRAIGYYDKSITAAPGYQASLMGKNRALELKGQFEEALRTAHWAASYVGPSAKQQIWLAREYEERGDLDNALLRLRQGVAMEPKSPLAHKELGLFLIRCGRQRAGVNELIRSYRLDPNQKDVADKLRSLGEPLPVPPPSQSASTRG